MSVRQKIRDRLLVLLKTHKLAKEKGDEATMVDCVIRTQELRRLLKELRK